MRGRTTRTYRELSAEGVAPEIAPDLAQRLEDNFSIGITPTIMDIVRSADPTGGVAKQFVPDLSELTFLEDELADPIGDAPHSPVPGIIHRYPDRVLLNLLHSCAVYCRYCFRREQIGAHAKALSKVQIAAALTYISRTPAIWEVILSGGDPLLLSAARLADVRSQIDMVRHVEVLRVHTRVPVVDPVRITDGLVDALKGRTPCYIVVHCNHPDELSAPAIIALNRLADAGFPMLSQSVLLAGINDDITTLSTLFKLLVKNRVRPYYLHHLDKARGTARFRGTVQKGQKLVKELRGRFSGLCQPTYVIDIPGGFGKVPLTPSYADIKEDRLTIMDPNGGAHYCDNTE